MASARDRSIYEQFTIESADGTKTVDIKEGVSAFVYYESVLSPCVTASVVVINTGGTLAGEDGVKQGIYNGLPLEEVKIIKVTKILLIMTDLIFQMIQQNTFMLLLLQMLLLILKEKYLN